MGRLAAQSRRHGRLATGQRGGIAIIVGLSIVIMIGFAGLAIDGGRLYLTKTELQNGADACALAASYHLTGAPTIAAGSFAAADASGRTVAQRNRVNFQGTAISSGEVIIEFSTALSGAGWSTAAGTPPGAAKYVRCTIQRTGITPFLMQVLGFGDATVDGIATASLANSQTNCAVPMALCTKGAAPDYGYAPGEWVGIDFSESSGQGGNVNYTGNFRWIDFNPGAITPGCSGNGAAELSCIMQGTGQCSLPPPIASVCTSSGSSNPTPGCVGQNGSITSMDGPYNSRFGVYKNGQGNPQLATAPPDYTGYSYNATNWPLASNAYAGTVSGASNYEAARAAHLGTQNSFVNNPFNGSSVADHTTYGADRRLVVVPIVDCSQFTSAGQHAPIKAYACVLMLNPYDKQGNNVTSKLEYIGRADVAGSPCATSGIAGNDTSQGPKVPALVQ